MYTFSRRINAVDTLSCGFFFCETNIAMNEEEPDIAPTTPAPVDAIRGECERLAADDGVEKSIALRIMNIFHDMHALLISTQHTAERQIAALQSQLDNISATEKFKAEAKKAEYDKEQLKVLLRQHQEQLAQNSKRK